MAMASNKMSDAGSQTDILGDSEGCLSGSKQEHTELAASDLHDRKGTLALWQMCIGGPRLGYQNLEGVTSGHPTWSNLELL